MLSSDDSIVKQFCPKGYCSSPAVWKDTSILLSAGGRRAREKLSGYIILRHRSPALS